MFKKPPPRSQKTIAQIPESNVAVPAVAQGEFALPDDGSAKARLDHVIASVQIALALAWAPKGRTLLLRYLQCLQFRHAHGAMINHAELGIALDNMEKRGLVVRTDQGIALAEPMRTELGIEVLFDRRIAEWRTKVFEAENFHGADRWGSAYFNSLSQATTIARLVFYAGSVEEWQALIANNSSRYARDAYNALLASPFVEGLWVRVQPPLRNAILSQVIAGFFQHLDKSGAQYIDWAIGRVEADRKSLPDELRYPLVEVLLLRGDFAKAQAFLADDKSEFAELLRAALAACAGEWEHAVAAFEALEKPLKALTASRKNYMSARIAWLFPMSRSRSAGRSG